MSERSLAAGDSGERAGLAAASILEAIDPAQSAVVEACAGSGKTWLLASRIVRLLIAGLAPGEILAITFTRKAAREIEERVVLWLQLLATADASALSVFLAERGIAENDEVVRRARGLYERVLRAQPPLAVTTFHGWFLQLVEAAPLADKVAGARLVEVDSRLFAELWQSFALALQKAPSSPATEAFVRLVDDAGLEATRRLIRRALARRSEWLAFGRGCGGAGASAVVAALAELFGGGAGEGSEGASGQALGEFFAGAEGRDAGAGSERAEAAGAALQGAMSAEFAAYLDCLGQSPLASDLALRDELALALAESDRAACFARLCAVLLTKDKGLRQRSAGPTLTKRFGSAGAARFLDLHARLGERVLACLERQLEERILAFNRDACAVFAAFLTHVEAFKKARRQFDFADAEWKVLELLRNESSAGFVQARLDARYREVLVDEFQDTNPLQWQILTAWLAAYSDASRPGVFIVGDPKQSIYRFRRAEPRLFTVAADFLVREYGAVYCVRDETFRNAPAIVDVVNALFSGLPEFLPFRRQSSLARDLPGRVELMPLAARAPALEMPPRLRLRDPLSEADDESEDERLSLEAQTLAQKILQIVGRRRERQASGEEGGEGEEGEAWLIEERMAGGERRQRPARYGDILVLSRTRTQLAIYERALAAADIPFDVASRGGLLSALEVRDINALLEFLVSPVDDLKLAQALRSPLFACTDDDLLALAGRDEASWWQRLQALVAGRSASARLERAERLLDDWLRAAERLPAHDLIDRIYHEGEASERYRLAVPEPMAASVEANLRALLLLALDVDGGRYPSLPRFIDELRDLAVAEANDAPDEGEIETLHADDGRVRLLTIHSAKGLEAPIVWLIGANSAPRSQDPWDILVDWPPAAPAPRHFSFFARKEERGTARQAIFEAEAAAARREELNLLYVALTRAKQVFIASGIESAKAAGRGSVDAPAAAGRLTPYRLLEAALGRLGASLAYGDALPVAAADDAGASAAANAKPASAESPLPAIGERRPAADAGERFGILLHALLERATGPHSRAPGLAVGKRDEAGLCLPGGFDEAEYRQVLPVAERLLAATVLQRFFDPAQHRRAWNEVEVASADGLLRRIDRLVEFEEAVWVLDYKSSGRDSARLADYERQLRDYCAAVSAIFPGRPVRGALVFADAVLVEVG